MKYPMANNWLTYKRRDGELYEVYDYMDKTTYIMDVSMACFLKSLDGKTNPDDVDPTLSAMQVDNLLEALGEEGLLRPPCVLLKSFGTILWTVFIPERTTTIRKSAAFLNSALQLLWLPLLLVSIAVFGNSPGRLPNLHTDHPLLGAVLGLVAGIVFHELGHACACIAVNGKLFEIGIMVRRFMPGAYCLMDLSGVRNRIKRAQVSAAGIEVNFLLTACFLFSAMSTPALNGIMICAAVENLLLALINLMFIEGLDGMAIISDLLGIDDFISYAKKVLKRKKERERLLRNNPSGRLVLISCVTVLILQIVLPVLFCLNIVEVLSCFM